MRRTIVLLVFLGCMHGLVDGACAMCIWWLFTSATIATTVFTTLVISYNLIAFALQAPLGLLVDSTGTATWSAAIGAVVTGFGILLFPTMPMAGICIAGLGNALFHVGGGAHAISATPGQASGPGLFVAPGAAGLFAGACLGKAMYLPNIYVALVLILGAAAVFFICPRKGSIKVKTVKSMPIGGMISVAALLFFSVMVRSVAGMAVGAMWNDGAILAAVLVGATVGGKAFGGIVADKAGWLITGTACLLSSALLIGIASGNTAVIAIGVLLLHATMGITVAAMVRVLGSYPATAFGLCSLAIILGGMPMFFSVKTLFCNSSTIVALVFVSGLSLFIALKKVQSHGKNIVGIIERSSGSIL